MDGTGRLIIVCGLPGTGKTTRAKELEIRLRAVRFCPDEWMDALSIDLREEASRARIEGLQWEFGQALLKLGLTVIIEWGTWGRTERDSLRLEARCLGATVDLHYLTAPVDTLYERIRLRRMEDPPIQREDLVKWSAAFQAPTPDEFSLFDHFETIAS